MLRFNGRGRRCSSRPDPLAKSQHTVLLCKDATSDMQDLTVFPVVGEGSTLESSRRIAMSASAPLIKTPLTVPHSSWWHRVF